MNSGDQLLEAVTADTIAGEINRASKHSLPIGTPCPNCRTAIAGPWCYACGQKGEEFHRSIWHLVAEAFEGLTHFDGRLWTTLPRLAARPGRLTRDFVEGHRAPQVPPFQMFLVVLLIVFFTGALNFKTDSHTLHVATPNDPAVQKALPAELRNHLQLDFGSGPTEQWFERHVTSAVANQEVFFATVERWSHQFAILMLPISALLLTGIFAFRKGVYVFDHLIFAMHSLSFQGLLLACFFLVGMATEQAGWLLLIAPVEAGANALPAPPPQDPSAPPLVLPFQPPPKVPQPPPPATPPSAPANEAAPAPVVVGGYAPMDPRAPELKPVLQAALARLLPAGRGRGKIALLTKRRI